MRFSSSRRRERGSRVFSCRACCPTERAIRSRSNDSKTSSAIAATPRARSSFTARTAWLVGEPGRGIQTIVEMVNATRLDCIIGSAALLRAALAQAIHHATYRRTFGAPLDRSSLDAKRAWPISRSNRKQPRRSLCDSRKPSTTRRTARTLPRYAASARRSGSSTSANARRPSSAKRSNVSAATATSRNRSCRGSIAKRRSTRFGKAAGNINALDVLRIFKNSPRRSKRSTQELTPALGDPRIAAAARKLRDELADEDVEWRARSLVERMALLVAGELVARAGAELRERLLHRKPSRHRKAVARSARCRSRPRLRGIVDRAAPAT